MLFIKEVPKDESEAIKVMLRKLGVPKPPVLKRGEVKLYNVSSKRLKKIEALLMENGYSLAVGKKEILSEKIKLIIEEMLEEDHYPVVNISVHISRTMGYNYTYLSDMFSELNGITIEQHVIKCRIAKAQQLLKTTDLAIGEIAARLHYKNVAHFSSQFKKLVGCTPSEYNKSPDGPYPSLQCAE